MAEPFDRWQNLRIPTSESQLEEVYFEYNLIRNLGPRLDVGAILEYFGPILWPTCRYVMYYFVAIIQIPSPVGLI